MRTAREGEIERILPMYDWLFASPGARAPQWETRRASAALADAIRAERAEVLVDELDCELVGLCVVFLDINSVRYGQRAWIEDLVVHPERRSEGVGARLLDGARAWARQAGATHLELDTGEARVDARRFYERNDPDARGFTYSWYL